MGGWNFPAGWINYTDGTNDVSGLSVESPPLLFCERYFHLEGRNIHPEGQNDILEGVDRIVPGSTLSGPADNINDDKDLEAPMSM